MINPLKVIKISNNQETNLKGVENKNWILLASVFSSFLVAFATSSISVALPQISISLADIHGNLVSGVLQNWIAASFLLSIAIFSVPFGKLTGTFGLKKSFLLGIIVFTIFSILSSCSSSAEFLIILRFLQGLGASIINITTLAMVTEAFPPQKRGKGIGLNTAGIYIGLTLSPVIGGFLTHNFGWRTLFLSMIPFLILIILITLSKIPQEWSDRENEKFDYTGSFIYCLAILLLIYGFTILNETTGVILVTVAIILLIAFVKLELSHKTPIFNVKLFNNVVFTSSTIASLISYLATFLVTYILTYYLQYVKGMDPQTTGLILIATPIFMAILAPFSGKLSDKIYPQVLSAIGMCFVTIALIMLIFLNETTPVYFIIMAMVLQGIGYGLFSSPNANAIMGSVPRHLSSVASATITTMRVIGQTLSIGMLTVIFAFIMGSNPIVGHLPQLIQSSTLALTISAGLCFISIIASLVGIKSKLSRGQKSFH
ncbi:MAG: MFS transporter [Methanobrevibacter sp.]|nr:MFS transporter [Candidatus Methanovirga aequatorialis]